MAGSVNGALGVKCAHPDRPVIVGCGDGCYLLSGFELLTAVQYDIPVIWIIFNDNEFKLIKLYQLSAYGESGLVEFENPDYAAYAQACGAKGYRVETLDEFEDALGSAGVRQAGDHRRPHHPSRAAALQPVARGAAAGNCGVDHGPLARRLRHIAIVLARAGRCFATNLVSSPASPLAVCFMRNPVPAPKIRKGADD